MFFLCVHKERTKEMHPEKPPFGFIRSLGEKSARNKLAPLKQKLLVSLIFPSLAHRLQGDPSYVLKFTVQEKIPDNLLIVEV